MQPNQILPTLLGLVGVFTFLVLTKEDTPDSTETLSALATEPVSFEAGSSTAPQSLATGATSTEAAAAPLNTAAVSAKPIVRVGGGAYRPSSNSAGSFKRIAISAN